MPLVSNKCMFVTNVAPIKGKQTDFPTGYDLFPRSNFTKKKEINQTLISLLLCFVYKITKHFSAFTAERKEDETDENWMEKEKEKANKEREQQERGKRTQM